MKQKTGFRLRTLGKEYILTAEAGKNINFNKMVCMNPSAVFLWQSVEGKDFTVKDLADLLVEKYEIDRETAERDSKSIAEKWIEAGIVEA